MLRFGGAPTAVIDATKPLEQVKVEARNLVWKAILEKTAAAQAGTGIAERA
jgi:hypothetical protein